jgi:tetratricopeptide (TPR) repeat protein
MAQIGLREYDREIESMIDRGQIDEAIAHCKSILKEFPKHIETYRLLGKCYLESQRYVEAADILQRVLSVYPDDFISHIGMSIICEDENNLEKAIWHMERSLEVQPSNSAVNSELRRLLTLRDGSEPSKVHLSQGAYIRMCVKSGLHEQAIAEAKSAISKEPQRIDLDLILAKMYF